MAEHKKQQPHPRCDDQDTYKTFKEIYDYVFPSSRYETLSTSELDNIWSQVKDQDEGRPKSVVEVHARSVVVFLYGSNRREKPVHAFRVHPQFGEHDRITSEDAHFCRCLSYAYNMDVALCNLKPQSEELWSYLRQVQFLRAITRFFSISTHSANFWLQAMENSMSLTYEGKTAQYCIIVSRKVPETVKKLGDNFVQLQGTPDVHELLLREKWVRSVVDGKRLALVGSKKRKISGFISIPGIQRSVMSSAENRPIFAPHDSLIWAQSVLADNDLCIIGTQNHDLYVMHASGIVFHKTQGCWSYNNYDHVYQLLSDMISHGICRDLIRMALDLSYERKGALFVILHKGVQIEQLIRDRHVSDRPNHILRNTLGSFDIGNWSHRQMITSIAATDGSVIIDHNGRIRDAACMIAPDDNLLKELANSNQLRTFSGARTTAAYKASYFGISIKISEDGPISIWKGGEEIYKVL